jgi:hypothetical protein
MIAIAAASKARSTNRTTLKGLFIVILQKGKPDISVLLSGA